MKKSYLAIVLGLILLILFILVLYFRFGSNLPLNLVSNNSSNNCPQNWKNYRQDTLGVEFCYPAEWGKPKTDPIANLTKLDGAVDKFSKDTLNTYSNSIFINFANATTPAPQLRFFNEKYQGEFYPNSNAEPYGPTDSIAKIKSTGNICDYKTDFHSAYPNTLTEIWNNCASGIKTSLVENMEVFSPDFSPTLFSYSLKSFTFKKIQNGYFNNLLISSQFEYLSQNKERLTTFNQFFNASKNSSIQRDKPMITQAQFEEQRKQFIQFVKSIKTFKPVQANVVAFQPVAGESQDLTTIRQYYYNLANHQLQSAFNMHAESLDFAKFQDQYKNVIKASPRDFVNIGNGQYEFYVDYQENNTKPTVYHVILQVSKDKIKTVLSEEITTEIVKSGIYSSFTKSVDNKNYMVLMENGREIILDQGEVYNEQTDNIGQLASFGGQKFSPNGKYLYYVKYGWESAASRVYDLQNKKQIVEMGGAATYGFTDNENYFYACSDPGMGSGDGAVISLSDGKIVYDLLKDTRISDYGAYGCSYQPGDSFITFKLSNYYTQEGQPKQPDQTIKFSF